VVDFTRPILNNTFTIIAKPEFNATNWSDLNRPEVKVAVDIGSTHDLYARRALPNATLGALRTPDEAVLAVQSGRADCVIQVVMLALVTVKKNPRVGRIIFPRPTVQQPTCCGLRIDSDQRFRSFVDNWLEYNRSLGTIRAWITESLALVDVRPEDIPAELQF
jgi:polar amino acid transport system substrate-binding protein